ncbi:MAG: cell division protein ZipA [Gammaproteobacteria bacterium]|nr:cell division protein ZipA [Gammaproteobacteria bacterium]
MDGLRWLLLLFGLLVIAGVYWYSRREQTPKDGADLIERRTPTLDGAADPPPAAEPTESFTIGAAADSVELGPTPADDAAAAPDNAVEQKVVALRLVARDGGVFKGDELILSLRGIGMRHGKFGIFHRIDGNDEERTVFSAASLVEPGSFDLANIREQTIPGISLFLVLPGPIDGADAFDLMMAAARTLAQSLNAELLDESGSTLSIQRERYLREEIVQFEHSNKVA